MSNVGSWMQTVALAVVVTDRSHNPLWTGAVAAAAFVPIGVLSPLGGALADRLDRRRWLITTTVAEAGFAAVLAVLAATGHAPSWALLVVAFFGGVSAAVGFPTYQAMIPDLVPTEDLLGAVSLSSAQYNLGRVIGPALAGVVLLAGSPAWVFAVNAASFSAVVGALAIVELPPTRPGAGGSGRIRHRIAEGARIAAAEPGCRSAIVLIGVVAFIGSPFIALVPAVAITALHRGAAGRRCCSPPRASVRCRDRSCWRRWSWLSVAASSSGPSSPFPWPSSATGWRRRCGGRRWRSLVVGACYIGVLTGLNTVVQRRAPPEARGRVLGLVHDGPGRDLSRGGRGRGRHRARRRDPRRHRGVGGDPRSPSMVSIGVLRRPVFTALEDPVAAVSSRSSTPSEPAPAEEAQRRVAGGASTRAGVGPGGPGRLLPAVVGSPPVCVLGAARRAWSRSCSTPPCCPPSATRLIADADPALVVTDPSGLEDLLAGPDAELAPYPVVRPMHYTSGTTGRPKGVWSGELDAGEARALFEDEADVWGFDATDTHLVCSPMYHSVSVRLAAAALLRGGRVLVLPRFDAAAAVAALGDLAPTTTFMAPTALHRVLAAARDRSAAFSSLRLLVHAGSPCPAPLKRAASDRLRPGALWEFYGSTEGQFTVCGPEEWADAPGHRGPGPAGAAPRDRRRRRGVVPRSRLSPVSSTGATPPPRHGRGGPTPSRSATWAASTRTGTCSWRAGATTSSSAAASTCTRSRSRRCWPRRPASSRSPSSGSRTTTGANGCAPRWWATPTRPTLRRHATRRLAPYKRPKQYFRVGELPHTATGKLRRRDLPVGLGLAPPPPSGPG